MLVFRPFFQVTQVLKELQNYQTMKTDLQVNMNIRFFWFFSVFSCPIGEYLLNFLNFAACGSSVWPKQHRSKFEENSFLLGFFLFWLAITTPAAMAENLMDFGWYGGFLRADGLMCSTSKLRSNARILRQECWILSLLHQLKRHFQSLLSILRSF